ncbi:MAG: tetratricopeptide repeat protein, partial [Blastocatellia bacterium]
MKTFVTAYILCIALLLSLTVVTAVGQDNYDADRKRAFDLVQENNLIAALPLLEKLAVAKPEDTGVLQNLALALVAQAVANKNPEQMKLNFRRARELAEKCQKLGDNSQLVQTILEKIPTGDQMEAAPVKKNTPADDALQAGEAAFGSGDFKKALAEYERAEKLDPKLYEAPLFAGDMHFKLNDVEKAGAAYARAIAIDPDRDTAYRFWGNVLLQSGRMEESKQKLIEAIICEPYSRATWQYLSNWAQRNKKELSHPRVDIPTSSVQRKDDKNINITAMLSDKKDGTDAWTIY